MDERWEADWKKMLKESVEEIPWAHGRKEQILREVHREICAAEERRIVMKYSKKKMAVLAAAALVVFGSVSAVAAGKIVGLQSSRSAEHKLETAKEAEKEAKQVFGVEVEIPEFLGEGLVFQEAYKTEVEAVDESGHVAGTYPEIGISYGASYDVSLSISRTELLGVQLEEAGSDLREVYNGIELQVNEEPYLFLPPDAEPSEEDKKLNEEGKLSISYGSDEPERRTFSNVSWVMDGVTYDLFAFDAYGAEELLEMAKIYLDTLSGK